MQLICTSCHREIKPNQARLNDKVREIKVDVESITKILDNIKPGIYPAREGTSTVDNDQARTPISRTFLHQKEG